MHKASILYVEDDTVTRENYALVLQHYFERVYQACDGREALDLYYSIKPDALMLDINMPHIDGLKVVERVRSEDKSIPILILTAYSDKEKLLHAIPLGLTAYLLKPLKDADFKEAIAKVLEHLCVDRSIPLADGFVYDKIDSEMLYERKPVKLAKKEKRMLALLAEQPGYFITQKTLIYEIWFDETPDESHAAKLTQLVYRLHMKLSDIKGKKSAVIENSYALGYRLIV